MLEYLLLAQSCADEKQEAEMSDSEMFCNAWYFRAADVVAPCLAVAGAFLAAFALVQFINTF